MLKDPVYIGMTRWGDEVLPGRHEPLIDRDLFEKVQKVIAARGTEFCQCEARLSTLTAKGRFEYFYCLGAHNYRTEWGVRGIEPSPAIRHQVLADRHRSRPVRKCGRRGRCVTSPTC